MARAIEERPVSIPQVIHQMLLTFHSEQLGIVTPVDVYKRQSQNDRCSLLVRSTAYNSDQASAAPSSVC